MKAFTCLPNGVVWLMKLVLLKESSCPHVSGYQVNLMENEVIRVNGTTHHRYRLKLKAALITDLLCVHGNTVET